MKEYRVSYIDLGDGGQWYFDCFADNERHALEQCKDANWCRVIYVWEKM